MYLPVHNFNNRGGGKYDSKGIQIGDWMDINECYFNKYSQIVKIGKYQEGLKVGDWKFLIFSGINYETINVGKYDERGLKVGNWIDFNESYYQQMFLQCEGKYEDGLRVGEWKIKRDDGNQIYEIGGGQYDQQGNKIGYWVDVNEIFYSYSNNLIHEGIYQDNYRIGIWKVKFISNPQNQPNQM